MTVTRLSYVGTSIFTLHCGTNPLQSDRDPSLEHQRLEVPIENRVFDRVENNFYVMRVYGCREVVVEGGLWLPPNVREHV